MSEANQYPVRGGDGSGELREKTCVIRSVAFRQRHTFRRDIAA